MALNLKAIFGKQQAATQGVIDAVEELRVAVIVAQDRRQQIERLPVDRARAEAAIDEGIAMMARKLDVRTIVAALTRPASGSPRLDLGHVPEALFAPWLATVAPDALRSFFLDQVDDVYSSRDDPPEAERPAMIEQLDAEILSLELAEEKLLRMSEASGIPILRRADAAPEAVLAADTALPS